ncbi:MAG: lysozyme inhibitor LprI family protein [Methylovulum sp.]|uniref:lysozyme inhibitor LprI family protein n=1 Tax=Methylovulum sp. TaxID=1916980 RepID=UPI002626B7C6|nr:lysozyme inhibitor LprI family protein [Methylovulum sp.]MDD2725233.1 lysozyme inhibitor LprI family protein [Methylovulum sp.]MDD5124787.1 lysozyme inhibitor LprI family protein [Methylovulum sp.]
MKKIIFMVLLGLSSLAQANSACDTPKNDFDGLYCLDKVYLEADKELNNAYKKLKGQLDNQGQEALKTGQLVWMENRNNECSRHEANGFFVNLDCATKTTVERLRFLQDRARECASSGCQNSKL